MSGLAEKTWKEFYDSPGVLEAMDKVFRETGWTIKLHLDNNTGEVVKAVPLKSE